jgi:phosphate-selective porin OprO/OprP
MKTLLLAMLLSVSLEPLVATVYAQGRARVRFALGDHPSLSVGSALKLDFAARVERDGRRATPDVGIDRHQFDWQSPRVGIEGAVFRRFTFEVSRDLGDDAAWKDAYVNIRFSRRFELEAGRFKLPFGHETLTGRPNLDFLHRSLAATALSPSRDTGVMTHGRLLGQRVRYQAGYFARDGDNARTAQTRGAGRTVAARVVVAPFAPASDSPLASLAIGMATAASHLDHRLGLRGETVLEDGVFFDRVYVNGRRLRTGLEASWEKGPVSATAEYIVVSDQRKAMGFEDEDLDGVRASAWYLAGTWVLTGERKHGRVEPRRPLLRGGMGAVELAARIEALGFDTISHPGTALGFPTESGLLSNTDRVTTLGINWYVDHYVRVGANVVFESLADAQRSPAPTARGRFASTIVRVQFVL